MPDSDWVEIRPDEAAFEDLRTHIRTIAGNDQASAGRFYRAYQEIAKSIASNPYHGDQLTGNLMGLRKVYLDDPQYQGKPRFRVVYELEPDEGSPALARIRGVVRRAESIGYLVIAHRLGRRR